MGGPSAKVCLSAKFCVPVYKASILASLGGLLAKVGLSAKFCVLVFKASMLYYWVVDLSRSALTTILHITPGKYEPS